MNRITFFRRSLPVILGLALAVARLTEVGEDHRLAHPVADPPRVLEGLVPYLRGALVVAVVLVDGAQVVERLRHARRIADLVGAKIGFESEAGRGSTFWIDVPGSGGAPSLAGDPGAHRPADFSKAPGLNGKRTLLYVEDNASNLSLMEKIVGRIDGLEMISAGNAERALEIARDLVPDLILMDINLPGMDGVEALKHLRADEKTRAIPVIARTAAAMPEDIERGRKAGFDDYLTKPIDIGEILGVIGGALGD